MAETEDLLSNLRKHIEEKDEMIEEMMTQVADLEDEKEALRSELEKLKAAQS